MDHPRAISDIVNAYVPDASTAEREELANELTAFAAGLYEVFCTRQRFDESTSSMVQSDSPSIDL
jgi:hypothetical protein